jgi:beta-lactamase class A
MSSSVGQTAPRTRSTLLGAALLIVLAGCEARAPDAPAADVDVVAPALLRDTALERGLGEAAAELDGVVGVAALHLERRVQASLNGERRFALASVGKLPIAYAALASGAVAPTDTVAVKPGDIAPGATPFRAGAAAVVSELVERSIAYSDNTASDVLLRIAGGPAEVDRQLRELEVTDVRIDRSMREIFAAWRGGVEASFLESELDTGTPTGVVALLAALHHGERLTPAARRLLLTALEGSVTGPNRLRAGAPAGSVTGSKTGTLGPLTHDAGLITLPEGGGTIALVVLVRSDATLPARERTIAALARVVAEHFAGGGGAAIESRASIGSGAGR